MHRNQTPTDSRRSSRIAEQSPPPQPPPPEGVRRSRRIRGKKKLITQPIHQWTFLHSRWRRDKHGWRGEDDNSHANDCKKRVSLLSHEVESNGADISSIHKIPIHDSRMLNLKDTIAVVARWINPEDDNFMSHLLWRNGQGIKGLDVPFPSTDINYMMCIYKSPASKESPRQYVWIVHKESDQYRGVEELQIHFLAPSFEALSNDNDKEYAKIKKQIEKDRLEKGLLFMRTRNRKKQRKQDRCF